MKLLILILITVGFLVAGCSSKDHSHDDGIAYWTCPMHPEIKEDSQVGCPICGMDLTPVRQDDDDNHRHNGTEHRETEIEYWTCPMHPEIKDDEPGSCPICGMDLIPVSADRLADIESSSQGRLRISPIQQQHIGMQYDSVKKRSLKSSVRTIGRIVPDERRVAEVTLRVMGYVEKTHVNETGIKVRNGQPLVTVYSPDLVSSQQDYMVALRSNNTELIKRSRERLRLLNMPESEIERLTSAGAPLEQVTLTAPFDGVVMMKNVRNGMQVMPGMMLYTIVDISHVWLIADIYEVDLPYIRTGQLVSFELQGIPGETFTGTVSFIPPMVNMMSRTVSVRIEIPNPQERIKIDQYGWVSFVEELGERLTVHRDAVLLTGKRAVVFKEVGRGRFDPTEVHLGPLAGEYYEVLHGLEENDRVVTSGRFFLDAESRLRGIGTTAVEIHQH
jgi:membrane fusion protein, copper/silver efflux system